VPGSKEGNDGVGDWQVTATTIYCDAVDEDVTIMVYSDGSTKCSGYIKYIEKANRETAKILRVRAKRLNRSLRCEGPQDYRVADYRDGLAAGEKGAST
jgi:hypothetical protein